MVVDFDFVAQPLATVHFGNVTYQCADDVELGAVIRRWDTVMRTAPDEVSSTLLLPPRTAGTPPSATVLVCFGGSAGTSVLTIDAAIEPLLGLGTVTQASIREQRYSEILDVAPQPPPQLRLEARDTLLTCLDAGVVDDIAALTNNVVPTAVAIRSLGGAFGRVPGDATAFAHRGARAMVVALVMFPTSATEAQVEAGLERWRGVAVHGIGTYLNFHGSAQQADLASAFPPATLARLARVKQRYDPDNRFALNHNIRPAGHDGSARTHHHEERR